MTNIGQNEFLKLYDIIKSDNLTSFCLLYENNKQLLKFSFGRFPILSICYLYHSKKIISKFEKAMCKIKDFIIIDEPFLLYRDFRSICGHLIKVYANQTSFVMPLEMKAILHKDGFVKRNFAEFAKSAETCKNLTAIYNLSNQKCIIADKKIKIFAKKL